MEIIKFEPQQLQQLPEVLTQNELSRSNAIAVVRPVIDKLKSIDLTTVDAQEMENNDAVLNDYQARLSVTVETMEGRRKPYTKMFDEVKKCFTSKEIEVNAILYEVKDLRNKWNAEKDRRNRAVEEEKDRQLARLQEVVDIKAQVKETLYERFYARLSKEILTMNEIFNSFAVISLKGFEGFELSPFNFDYFTTGFPIIAGKHLNALECAPIAGSVFDEHKETLCKEWTEKLQAENARLIELVPSRINELQSGKDDSAKRLEEKKESLSADLYNVISGIESEADTEKLNASFDVAANATPVVALSKGTTKKQKYNPTTHKAYAAIIQYWVSKQMSLMTVEELSKKLSFMVTAANKALNEGTRLEADGLNVEDDYSTRTSKKTA